MGCTIAPKEFDKMQEFIQGKAFGAVAQSGERVVRNDEVRGSIPLGSTKFHEFKRRIHFGRLPDFRHVSRSKMAFRKLASGDEIQGPGMDSSDIRQMDWAIAAAEFNEAPAATQICGRTSHSSAQADPDLSCSCMTP